MLNKKAAAPVLFILLQDVLYGFGDSISKYAYESVPVYSLLTVRYWIAFAFLMLVFGKGVIRELKECRIKSLILPSVCIAASFLMSNFAMKLTSATSMAFLRSTTVILAPLLALVIYRKRYSLKHIPILLCVFAGMYFLCGGVGFSGFGTGELLSLLSALLSAGTLVFAGEAMSSVSPVTVTTVQAFSSAALASVCAGVYDGGIKLAGAAPSTWLTIVYLALLCTVSGYLLQNLALKRTAAGTVALLQCIYPVMTAVFSFIVLGERMSAGGLLGAGIILAAVAAETVIFGEKSEAK